MPDHPIDEELALTERVGRELARRGLTNQAGHLREYWVALKAGRAPKVWSHDLSVEWLRVLRLSPHEADYPVLPRMSDCPGCTVSQKFTAMNFPGGAKFKCGACKSQWLELDPCRFALDRRFTRLDAPALRDAICVDCGRKDVRYPSADDSLDDYALTVAQFEGGAAAVEGPGERKP